MDDDISVNIIVKKIPNLKQTFNFTYGEVSIDEERKAIRLHDTHDNDLKESLRKKGIFVDDEDFLIPLKRNKKQLWIPSYLPMKLLNVASSNMIGYLNKETNDYIFLQINGNPLECLNNHTKEYKNG